jgi:hypothetical protein
VPVGPDTIQRLLADAEAAEAQGYASLDAGDRDAALAHFQRAQDCRFFAAQLEAKEADRLSQVRESSTLEPMEAAQVRSRGAAVSAALIDPDSKTMFQAVLEEAKMSLPEWVATQEGLSHNTAQAWNKKPGAGGRPVPRVWADRIAKQFKRPALKLAKNWRNGIRE